MKAILEAGSPHRQMIGRFPRVPWLNSWNSTPPKEKFVLVVEQNSRVDFCAEVSGPRAYRARGTVERRRVAWDKKALEPADVVHQFT